MSSRQTQGRGVPAAVCGLTTSALAAERLCFYLTDGNEALMAAWGK